MICSCLLDSVSFFPFLFSVSKYWQRVVGPHGSVLGILFNLLLSNFRLEAALNFIFSFSSFNVCMLYLIWFTPQCQLLFVAFALCCAVIFSIMYYKLSSRDIDFILKGKEFGCYLNELPVERLIWVTTELRFLPHRGSGKKKSELSKMTAFCYWILSL